MNPIDLTDLPEPVAADIRRLVETLRARLTEPRPAPAAPADLPRWDGVVVSGLSRRDIYDDVR